MARFEQPTQRRDLLHDLDRVEVVDVTEVEFDVELAVVAAEGVVHLERGAGEMEASTSLKLSRSISVKRRSLRLGQRVQWLA